MYFWQINGGRIWSAEAAAFVNVVPAGVEVVPLYDDGRPAGVEYLRECVRFYGYELGVELMTPEEKQAAMQKQFTDAIQTRLDEFARTRNYDGILSAATYATSTVLKFYSEGQYAVEARDRTWAAAYVILGDVLAGRRPMPTLEEVIAELPALAWPGEEP